MRPEKESFKLARAGRPSQKLALPAESYGTLSQSQAEDIVKAAASRIATRKVRQECTSEILRAEQMRVEKVGVAREVPPSNSRAQLADTIGLQVDRLRTVRVVTKTHGREPDSTLEDVSKLGNSSREVLNIADTAADRFAVNLASPIVVQWSQPSGINPEGKHVHQVAVMTYTPVTVGFESIGRNQVRITTAKLLKRERQLSEEKIEPQARKKANETQISTVAQGDRDDEMVEQLLREMEELDESHKLSDEDEPVIDALLEELELENAGQDEGERSEFIDVEEVPVHCTGVYQVSVECICDVIKATGRPAKDIEAEGKFSYQSTEVDCSHERHYCQNPEEVIPQHPAFTRRKQFWVPHRKHSRRKTEDQQTGLQRLCWPTHRKHGRWKHARQQMGLRGLCWPTRRKHGRWKPGQIVMPPLPMKPRHDGTRRWCSQRKRTKWKSSNRERGNACSQDDAAMYVKLHPPNN